MKTNEDGVLILEGIQLDRECEICGGDGRDGLDRCPACLGAGYRLTEAGKILREFVLRHLGKPGLILVPVGLQPFNGPKHNRG